MPDTVLGACFVPAHFTLTTTLGGGHSRLPFTKEETESHRPSGGQSIDVNLSTECLFPLRQSFLEREEMTAVCSSSLPLCMLIITYRLKRIKNKHTSHLEPRFDLADLFFFSSQIIRQTGLRLSVDN